MIDNATITAFLATADAPRAKRFYETVLGLRVKSDDEFALAFDCDGIELRIRHDFLDQDDLGVWQAPSGARVAWFKDPDGNLLSLTEVGD